jgi:hypothetical protein
LQVIKQSGKAGNSRLAESNSLDIQRIGLIIKNGPEKCDFGPILGLAPRN